VFEVVRDGELVFSKKEQGRFPEDSEVLALLAPEDGS
jgi:selT/selW/selH-like putative selenoprotein